MKSQPINRDKSKKQTLIIDERSKESTPEITPTGDAPLRVINFVEVGGMMPQQIDLLLTEFRKTLRTPKHGVHYIVPIRNGKINADILFEHEWLEVVKNMCYIGDDGEIKLKDDIDDVKIIQKDVSSV